MADDINNIDDNAPLEEEIQVFGDDDTVATENTSEENQNVALEILKKLAIVGKNLHDTYSEENQDTGEGFIESIELLDDCRNLINSNQLLINIEQRDNITALLEYLKGKLDRRVNAVDGNDYNY